MTLRARLRARIGLLRQDGEQGMMATAMVVIIIGMGLAALMTPLVLTQVGATTHTDARVQALHQAEAGVNAMVGRIRAATATGSVSGLTSKLPCFDAGTPLGFHPAANAGYDATLQYYTSDPLRNLAGALTSCLAVTNGLVPSFALITSTGTSGTGSAKVSRTVTSTYAFDISDSYTPTATANAGTGGQVRFNPLGTGTAQCLDAGNVANPILHISACAALNLAASTSQLFNYTADRTLQWVASISAATPYGLCVSSTAPSTTVTMASCPSPGAATYDVQWSADDKSAFSQSRPSASTVCLGVPSGVTPAVATCSASYDPTASWLPTPATGDGAAGAAAGQLSNYSQFARCAQPVSQTVPTGASYPFTILYPCEQKPLASQVGWYQKFAFNQSTRQWVTNKPGDLTPYCLTSQGLTGKYVTLTACNLANPLQSWTDNGAAAADQSNASQWPFTTRYTIVDQNGLCLSLSPSAGASADWYTPTGTTAQYSKLITELCSIDGSARQKWNADPDPGSSMLKNTKEN